MKKIKFTLNDSRNRLLMLGVLILLLFIAVSIKLLWILRHFSHHLAVLPDRPSPPTPASFSSNFGGEEMGLRRLCTLPGTKAKQDTWFCQESQTIRAKRHLGDHLAPPPYANSCKKQRPGGGW